MFFRNWFILFITVIVLLASGSGWLIYKSKHGALRAYSTKFVDFVPVKSVPSLKKSYDVIVVGTDPEGITAAVSAARNGLKTLLVDSKGRTVLGGLMTEGWLNTIDMDYDTESKVLVPGGRMPYFNKGIFTEWYNMIEGDSFDIHVAANAFYKLVRNERNIDLFMGALAMEPLVDNASGTKAVQGMAITKQDGSIVNVHAETVIDATQDGDIAFAAGAPFTEGHDDIGDYGKRMAVTAIFKLNNVTADVWTQMVKRMRNDNDPSTGSSATSVYGYNGMRGYKPLNPNRVSMRGLNIGKGNDNTVLSNSFLIYGVDPFSIQSRDEAKQISLTELPRVIDFMKKTYPEFATINFGGIAPELYVRETRHLIGEYRLGVIDLLENKDQWDRIAFGSYPVDIQPTSPTEFGSIPFNPIKYAIPFRSLVPLKVDGLLVVGKSASYDSMAFGSARVIPNGMAEGQAAGAAAKVAFKHKITFRELSATPERVTELQKLLNGQGMELKPFKIKDQPYMEHKDYAGLKVAVYFGLIKGGYANDKFALDAPSNQQSVVYAMDAVVKKYPNAFPADPTKSVTDILKVKKNPASLAQTCYSITTAMNLPVTLEQAEAELIKRKLLSAATIASITNPHKVTTGDMFMVINDVLANLVGLQLP